MQAILLAWCANGDTEADVDHFEEKWTQAHKKLVVYLGMEFGKSMVEKVLRDLAGHW